MDHVVVTTLQHFYAFLHMSTTQSNDEQPLISSEGSETESLVQCSVSKSKSQHTLST